MLVVKRKLNQLISLGPKPGADPALTVEQLFASEPIEISIKRIGRRYVELGISAPAAVQVWRGRIKTDCDSETDSG